MAGCRPTRGLQSGSAHTVLPVPQRAFPGTGYSIGRGGGVGKSWGDGNVSARLLERHLGRALIPRKNGGVAEA